MGRLRVLVLLMVVMALAVPAHAETSEFTEYPLEMGSSPIGVAYGFGAVWYSDNHPSNKIGKIDPADGTVMAEYTSPTAGIHGALTTGLGSVWFAPETEDGAPTEVLYELDPNTGGITTFPLPADASPSRLTTGFDYVWYTSAVTNNATGRVDPDTGTVTEFPVPTADSQPVGIAADAEWIWFGEKQGTNLGRLDPASGAITEYPVGDEVCCGVAVGFDAVWFTAFNANYIGRFDPASEKITKYPIPTEGSVPLRLVAGDRFVWFTGYVGNQVGRLDPTTGEITEFGIPTDASMAFDLAYVEGAVWFAESNPDAPKIGRLVIDSFADDDGSVFEDDIEWLAAEGITKGRNPPANTLFCPADPVSRGQMAAFLHRALADQLTPSGPAAAFTDISGSVFEADIEWLFRTGVTKGCNPPDNTLFCPGDQVTRGQMAAFLVRALGLTDDGGGNSFVDDDGSVFEDDIAKLAAADITKGCNPPANDRFCPGDPVTRGQMAAFLRRALE